VPAVAVLAVVVLAVAGAGALAAAGGVSGATGHWRPPAHVTFYWQLQGTLRPHAVDVTDVDGFVTPKATVADLHARGRHVACYVDVGSWERWRPDASRFPPSVLGTSNGWPGEKWLDVRRLPVLEPIMRRRFAMCARKGFDAVEPDNIDGFENPTGLPITAADQLRYDRWVAHAVHALGLAVLQKNDPEQAAALQPSFDGVLDEQCNRYHECDSYQPYLRAGKPVIDAEYTSSLYPGFCANDTRLGITGALYNLSLNGRLYRPCPGAGPTADIEGGPAGRAVRRTAVSEPQSRRVPSGPVCPPVTHVPSCESGFTLGDPRRRPWPRSRGWRRG
jgi:hypothetical protein